MKNVNELEDMRDAAYKKLRLETSYVPFITLDFLREGRKTALTKEICDIFKIHKKYSLIHDWVLSILCQIETGFTVSDFSFGRTLIDLCYDVKRGAISEDCFWSEKGVQMMVSRLPVETKSSWLRPAIGGKSKTEK